MGMVGICTILFHCLYSTGCFRDEVYESAVNMDTISYRVIHNRKYAKLSIWNGRIRNFCTFFAKKYCNGEDADTWNWKFADAYGNAANVTWKSWTSCSAYFYTIFYNCEWMLVHCMNVS